MLKLGLLLSVLALPTLGAASAKLVPPEDRVLLFIGQNRDSIDDYVEDVGKTPAGFMFYTSIQELDGLDDPADHGAGITHAAHTLENYPDAALQMGLYMVGALKGVNSGRYNKNIDRLADWIKRTNRPVYLRIGYEFDLPDNDYEPAAYAAAFRRIVNRFRKAKVENVAFVWHSYAAAFPGLTVESWYPGDNYVDWFAISYFDQSRERMQPMVTMAQERGKPLMIAEATPKGIGVRNGERAWRAWFQHLFKFIEENQVAALSYINTDWDSQPMWKGQNWGNSRVQDNPVTLQNWLTEISKPQYIHLSDTLYEDLNFNPQ